MWGLLNNPGIFLIKKKKSRIIDSMWTALELSSVNTIFHQNDDIYI